MAGKPTNVDVNQEATSLLGYDTESGTTLRDQDSSNAARHFTGPVLALSSVVLAALVIFLVRDLHQGAVPVFKMAAIAFIMIALAIMSRLR
ncbi:hypothetical protein PG993_012796 [Apiospora rasikravindrae]|uniref:DUF2631 domain-containing protein n=1 Tax=Apiospora rasikravindrae TaxID=990691 RepID=A0ABR1RVU6_9PEZI